LLLLMAAVRWFLTSLEEERKRAVD